MFVQVKSLLDRILKRGTPASIGQHSLSNEHSVSGTGRSHQPQSGKSAPVVSPVPGRTGISFLVDDVVPSAKPLWVSTLGEALELRSAASIIIMADRELPALATEGYVGSQSREAAECAAYVPPLRAMCNGVSLSDPTSFPKTWADSRISVHPLIDAVNLAFSDHRPLILSPDTIWLTIVQGFAQHLRLNAEAFRGRIVSHHGKTDLRIKILPLDASEWPHMISRFASQIRDNSDPFLYETLSCEFSTTTPTIKTAYQIALMEGFDRYFEYVLEYVCGIPKITLEGTPEDWQRIRDRIEVLATFDFSWWTARLGPVLDQFISTAKGAPDLTFWQAIYKPREMYDSKLATGWIVDLFPYLGREASIKRNSHLEAERIDWLPQATDSNQSLGASLESFPAGISRVPIVIEFSDDTKTAIELLGGFFGVSQALEDGALSPIISWAVAKTDTRVSPPPIRLEDIDAAFIEEQFKKLVASRLKRQKE